MFNYNLQTTAYLVVEQQFWTFEISRGNADIVLLTRVVELGKTPVNQS